MRFITVYHRLNQKLVRKTDPLPGIGEIMHQLGRLQYAKTLDLSMGYYTTRLWPASQYMMTIVTEFGKFKYNYYPIDICGSVDILS